MRLARAWRPSSDPLPGISIPWQRLPFRTRCRQTTSGRRHLCRIDIFGLPVDRVIIGMSLPHCICNV